MISAKILAKQAEKFALDNAPAILTGVAVIGSLATAYLTGKATFRASKQIDEEWDRIISETPDPWVFDNKDKVKLVWKEYIPPAIALTTTVASIVCANRVSTKRAAAMAAAYSLLEGRSTEYRDKVAEKFGVNKERQTQDELAQDQVSNHPPTNSQMVIMGNGKVLCYDRPSDRYFQSDMETIRGLQNDINAEVNEVGFANLDSLYTGLGIEPTDFGDELGWTRDSMLDIKFSAVITKDNQPCIALNYQCKPTREYAKMGDRRYGEGCDQDPPF